MNVHWHSSTSTFALTRNTNPGLLGQILHLLDPSTTPASSSYGIFILHDIHAKMGPDNTQNDLKQWCDIHMPLGENRLRMHI